MWPEQEAQGTAVPQLFLQQLAAVGEGGQQAALLQLLQASLAKVLPQPQQAAVQALALRFGSWAACTVDCCSGGALIGS